MTFQIRIFTEQDLPNLVKLLNKAYENAYEFTPYTEDGLKSWIQERHFQVLIAVEDGETVGSVAYNDGHWGEEIELLAVAESSNRKVIEDELISRIEKYVKRQLVFTAVDAGSPKIGEWIERGYKPEGGLYQMIVRLEGVKPLPKVPDDIILRSLRPEEEKELAEAVNAGFGWERMKAGIIERWKSECPPFSEEWVHVAEHNGKIVSVVASRPDVDYNEHFDSKRGYLGPAATLQEYRGKNLASALTQRAMNFLFEKGMYSVALYTAEQNIPSTTLLQKLGFTVGHNWKFMRKTFPQKQV
jgi:ribosomal protein S18 acetylase RimI-like enzyme